MVFFISNIEYLMILIHKVNDQIMECKNTHYGFKMMNAIYYYYFVVFLHSFVPQTKK